MELQPNDIKYNVAGYSFSKRQRKEKKRSKLQLNLNKTNNKSSVAIQQWNSNDKKNNKKSLKILNKQYCNMGLKELKQDTETESDYIINTIYRCCQCDKRSYYQESLHGTFSLNDHNKHGVLPWPMTINQHSFSQTICDVCACCAICNEKYSPPELISIDCMICKSKLIKKAKDKLHHECICIYCVANSDGEVSEILQKHSHCVICDKRYDNIELVVIPCTICKISLLSELKANINNMCRDCADRMHVCTYDNVSEFCHKFHINDRINENCYHNARIPVIRKNMKTSAMEWEFAPNWYGYLLDAQAQHSQYYDNYYNINANVYNDYGYYGNNHYTICDKKYKVFCMECLATPLRKCSFNGCNNLDESKFCENHFKCTVCAKYLFFKDIGHSICQICGGVYCFYHYRGTAADECGTDEYCKNCVIHQERKIYQVIIFYLIKQASSQLFLNKDVVNIILRFCAGYAIICGNYNKCQNVMILGTSNLDWFPKRAIFYCIYDKVIEENIANKCSYIHGVYIRAFCSECHANVGIFDNIINNCINNYYLKTCKKSKCTNMDVDETCWNHKLFKCSECNELKVLSDEKCFVCGNCYCYQCIRVLKKKQKRRSRPPMLSHSIEQEIILKDGKCMDCYSFVKQKTNLLNCIKWWIPSDEITMN